MVWNLYLENNFHWLIDSTADNIPGVPGVGEKTAQVLLQGLGGLDALFSNLDKISTLTFRGAKTMSAKLEQNKDVAYLSYKLATIKIDVELDVTCDELKFRPLMMINYIKLFSRYEFKRWLVDVEAGKWLDGKKDRPTAQTSNRAFAVAEPVEAVEVTAVLSQENYQTIFDEKSLADWIERLKKQKFSLLDTETDGLDTLSSNLPVPYLSPLHRVRPLICPWRMIIWILLPNSTGIGYWPR